MNRNFNMEEFLTIVIPSMLTDRTDYYIKGGLAYDVYFKEKTNSIDFDIVGTPEFSEYITRYLSEYSSSFGINLIIKPSKRVEKNGANTFEGYTVDVRIHFLWILLYLNLF